MVQIFDVNLVKYIVLNNYWVIHLFFMLVKVNILT